MLILVLEYKLFWYSMELAYTLLYAYVYTDSLIQIPDGLSYADHRDGLSSSSFLLDPR